MGLASELGTGGGDALWWAARVLVGEGGGGAGLGQAA